MNETNHLVQRRVRSFVSGRRRITSSQQKAIDGLWAKYGFENNEFPTFRDPGPIILELGFGNGESLLEMARKYSDCNFIGIEVYPPGIGHLLMKLEQLDLTNVRIYRNDAVEVFSRCISDAYLSRVNLYFPDPWPKRRHHKRRLVTRAFISLVARKLKAGGLFHITTDWKDYADHIKSVLSQSTRFRNVSDDSRFAELLNDRRITRFEQRGMRLGYSVSNLMFERA